FQDSAPKLSVKDYAWNGRNGFKALMNFLSRFSADYSTVVLPVPSDIDLMSFLDNPYSITASPHRNFMARVINAEKALSLLKKPEGASFTVKVNDELIAENNGIWLVRGDEATPTDAQPDITLSERAFSILAIGAIGFEEAALRNDVEISGNEETLRRVFVRKPIYIADHF
ncbi:MAG: sterol carrier protein domain-containing protein, partial [Victivallales bacterium]|nr:sterol carrier protein domain-containing protein [Victivallales bacterium]